MDEPLEDEKKPFEAEGMAEEDMLPDPDEQLMLHQGNGRVWLVKVSHKYSPLGFVSNILGAGPKTSHGALVRY